MGVFDIEANELPAVRIASAIGNGVNRDLLLVVGGGLGDRVCAEPTIRYAVENLRYNTISLCCSTPELYTHLRFEKIYTDHRTVPLGQYLPIYTYAQGNLANQLFNANLMHPVDFASVSALRMTLPKSQRRIVTPVFDVKNPAIVRAIDRDNAVLVHPGKSWPSRTQPTKWWDNVIQTLIDVNMRVVLVGNDTQPVSVEYEERFLDFRGMLSVSEFYFACWFARAIVTNDSAPVHLAAPGTGRIAFLSTVRDPELLLHERMGGFGHRTMNFSKNTPWRLFDHTPNTLEPVSLYTLPRAMEDFLPEPGEITEWITR